MTKPCDHCGTILTRHKWETPRELQERRFCSLACSNKYRATPPGEKVLNNILVMPNGCWEWQMYRDRKGYGRAEDRTSGEVLAHRIAWIAARGPIPKGLHVLHKCDNPPCCNVDHLFLGTNEDNAADREAKGRSRGAKGERNAKAKLTADDVRAIRALAGTHAEIGRRYGVAYGTIAAIRKRTTWAHLP